MGDAAEVIYKGNGADQCVAEEGAAGHTPLAGAGAGIGANGDVNAALHDVPASVAAAIADVAQAAASEGVQSTRLKHVCINLCCAGLYSPTVDGFFRRFIRIYKLSTIRSYRVCCKEL